MRAALTAWGVLVVPTFLFFWARCAVGARADASLPTPPEAQP